MERRLTDRVYNRLAQRLPPTLAGSLDRYWPSLASSWGGPLNGQQGRRAIVRDVARSSDFDAVIETGTYRGTSTEFFVNVFGCPVYSVEGQQRFFTYSAKRLAYEPAISVVKGDSRTFLRDMRQRVGADEHVFFYLDAHWGEDLPLKEELEIIGSHWSRAVVMIDDFEVPDDSDYGFDDYGPGRALSARYLPWTVLDGWGIFYPSLSASQESGRRRGSCVLGAPAELSKLTDCQTLRQGEVPTA